MSEWKDITTTTLIPGKTYRIKITDTNFDNVCLYVDGGCFIFYDATKPGGLGCVERKVVFSDAVPSSMVALALPIGDYKVSDNTEFPLPIPCQIMKIYSDIEPGCVMIKELE